MAEKAETIAFDQPTAVEESKHANVKKAYGQLPLYFEANQGQADASVKFLFIEFPGAGRLAAEFGGKSLWVFGVPVL